jgi:hypothetical protein
LYNINDDYSQANNLAEKEQAKLKELQGIWWTEAKKNNVLPLDGSFAERVDPSIRPSLTRGRNHFEYYEGAIRIPEASAPDFKNKSWTLNAEIVTEKNPEGVLATMGGYFGGLVLMVKNGKPTFQYRVSNQAKHLVSLQSPQRLSPGKHTLSVAFQYDGGGVGKGGNLILSVDGKEVVQKKVDATIGRRFSLDETWDVGEDTGTPVDFATYDVPFRFNGELKKLSVDLKPTVLTKADKNKLKEGERLVSMKKE